MPSLKLTLVGGGSYAWTPGVLANLITSPFLAGSHIVLHDIDPVPLDLTYPLALKYKDLTSSSITFEKTTDQAAALDGADYVIVTISTGRLKTMKVDLEVPEEFGIFQTVGDTCGPGGLSRALRNIPVFLGMARAMEKRCPDAWMLNVSNPLCAITRAVTKETSAKALGLCHGILGTARRYARFLGAKLSECAYTNTGIDHCSWFSEFRVRGEPAEKLLLDKGIDDWLAKPPVAAKKDPVFGPLYSFRCGLMLWRNLGVLPAIGDRHMAEFFPTFLQGMDNVEKYGLVRTTIADREGYYANARARIERLLSGEEQPELREATDVVGERQSDDLASWITALDGGRPIEDNLNAPNIGQIPELPPGAIVETRGVLDATGFRPIASPLPPQLVPVLLPQVLRDELTVEAAVEGSFEKALAVLTTDPLVGGIETARPMLQKMIALNKDWLPQFSN